MKKNSTGEWFVFNREYVPIGWSSKNRPEINGASDDEFSYIPVYTKYERLTENMLIKIFGNENCQRDESGAIDMVFFYGDGTNPVNVSTGTAQLYKDYFKKIEALAKLKSTRRRDY